MYALSSSVRKPVATARKFARVTLGALASGVVALLGACHDAPTADDRAPGQQDVRMALAANVMANPGAVLEAEIFFTAPGGTRRTLAHDSLVITTGAADTPLSLTADVSTCAVAAATSATTCTVNVALTLKRDGRVLDESNQQVAVTSATQTVAVPSVELFEVATVTIDTAGTGGLEPGDTKTLIAVAKDRSGVVVPGRSPAWSLVSGGVTVTPAGSLSVVSEGAATVRIVLGGRTSDLTFTVRPVSVASIDIAPVDTSIGIGGTFTYRVTPRSAAGAALTGRTVTLGTSSAAIATIVGNVATGISAGLATITATSTQGRAGATIAKTTTLRVQSVPVVRVDRNAVSFDLPPGGTGIATSVVVTTDTGRTLRGLVSSVTYTPNVAPWLTQSLVANTTPTTLTLRAAAGALDTGTYVADVNLSSTIDPSVPATVRVTLHVVRIIAAPRTVTFGPYTAGTTIFPPTSVVLRTSLAAVPLSGLTVRTEYIGAGTGWLTTALQATTAAPSTSVLLTPNPAGIPAGTSQARVIVTSATPVVSADTIIVSLIAGDPGRFSGLVVNAVNQTPISGATVIVRRLDNTLVDQVTTSVTGAWTSNPITAGTYNVFVTAPGFQDYVLYSQVLVGSATVATTPLANAQVVPVSTSSGDITGSVRDATTNGAIVAASVELRAGANNTTGTPLATTTTNANGGYSFAARLFGVYTVVATKTNYAAGSITVTLVSPSVVAPVTFLSPGGTSIAWRFVLSWGAQPLDLDAHLTGPLAATSARFHVFYPTQFRGSATSSPFAVLDVDATDGFGPETITITQQIAGVYRFYVDNFDYSSVGGGVTELRASSARVDVYQGNTLVSQFFPPQTNGKYWTVFEISGTVLTPINTIGPAAPALRASPAGSVQNNAKVDAAWEELMSLSPWSWTKPFGAIKRD
ncbi:MAG: carboxypeptidase regulatory-like domain-containing protein [Gemmatimonas sp.]